MPLFGAASMATASHRSIGEVLALLKDEFPDITISKIRFLESQGLLDPERTPSGYRRFYDKDVERLRWILRQQRENFLPLKVIKGRLAEGLDTAEDAEPTEPEPTEPEPVTEVATDAAAPAPAPEAPPVGPEPEPVAEEPAPAPSPSPPPPPVTTPGTPAAGHPAPGAPPPVEAPHAPPAPTTAPATDAGGRRVMPEPALFHRASEPTHSSLSELASGSSVSLTIDELAAASGVRVGDIADLERFGLIEHRSLGSTPVYDDEALLVARAAAAFLSHGIEARHLRMYKVAADRESGVFEQVVLPLVHQRNPEARRRAADTVDELARLGEVLHSAMLRRALKNIT
jgi:DNA-binding transcriptional MerR regulator